MLIDDVAIVVAAGSGGKGAVAFDTNKMARGAAGGSGGRGGSVYIEGVSDIGALRHFRFRKRFAAETGQDGRSQFRDGNDGDNLVLKVPVGTVIHAHPLTTYASPLWSNCSIMGMPEQQRMSSCDRHAVIHGESVEITRIGERTLVARGGKGGKGNFLFRSSRNTSPRQAQPGLPGEVFDVRLELKLIADVGLIGMPNAGKSSLLNALTRASAKVGNYAFTTLEPNLGTFYSLILADIPGLIEGASDGRGLGTKFLRHIARTNTLFHLVSAESGDVSAAYRTVRQELGQYDVALLRKPEIVFLSKADLVSPADLAQKRGALANLNARTYPLSIHDPALLDRAKKELQKLMVRNEG